MAFPDPERLSVQDLADRWGKSPEYVEECVRTFKFPHIMLVYPGDARRPPFEHYWYFDLSKYPEEALTRKVIAPGVFPSYVNPEDFPEGLRWNKSYLKIFIPRTVVEAFEREHDIGSYQKASQQDALNQAERLPNKQMFTIPEAATFLGKTQATIRRWIDQGILEALGPKGKHRRIPRSALLALKNTPT